MSLGSPFKKREYAEILNDFLDHITKGEIHILGESHTADGSLTYTLECDGVSGSLLSIDRLYGIKDDTFNEFTYLIDFTIDSANNQLTFVSGSEPDIDSIFYVDYYYNSGIETGLTDTSRSSVLSVLSAAVCRRLSALWNTLEVIRQGSWIDTATGNDLDAVVSIIGVTRNEASKASGYVTFYRDTAGSLQTINAGAVLSTINTDSQRSIQFETTEAVYFQDGFTSVRAPVQARDGYEGSEGNVTAGAINQIISGGGVATRVINPATYITDEFVDIIDGRYSYTLEDFPVRTVTDNGIIVISNYFDDDLSDWTPTNATITSGGTLGAGIIEVSNDDIEDNAWIESPASELGASPVDPIKYDKLHLLVRGTIGNRVKIEAIGDVTTIQTYHTFDTKDWTLVTFDISTVTDDLTTIRIYPVEASSVIYIDNVDVGKEMVEVHSVNDLLNGTNDNYLINYTSRKLNLRYNNDTDNFFDDYPESDYLHIRYKSHNYISGGTNRESDSELRERAKAELEVKAKGTKTAIKNAILDIDGVARCVVSDYNDDVSIEPGRIEVFVLSDGFTISPALQQDIVDVVDETRAAGIKADIFSPLIRYVNFELFLTYDDNRADFQTVGGLNSLRTQCISVVSDFFANIGINEGLYFSKLIGLIVNEVDGIVGGYVRWDNPNSPLIVDDDYNGTYDWDSLVILDNPQRISPEKENSTVVIQRGNIIDVSMIQFEKLSEK